MAAFVKLPSGKWQAQVRLPGGRRVTKTDPLKRVVAEWARDLETRLDRGEWRDPSAGRVTIEQRWETWRPGRVKARKTLEHYDLHWRLRIKPQLGGWPVSRLTRADVETWVAQMLAAGHGKRSIGQAVSVLSAFYASAVRDHLVAENPVRGVDVPRTPVKPPDWFTRDEAAGILAALEPPERATPDEQRRALAMRTLVDLAMHVGLRWGEICALSGARVDFLRARIHVVDALDGGQVRQYPKTRRSLREVPIPPHLVEPLSQLLVGRDRSALVFTSPRGTPLREPNFIRRVWRPALESAGVRYRPIHTMRHTAASWLVQAGVSLYVVQALLGHESFATTQQYAHLAPDRHDVVLGAWSSLATPAPHDQENAAGE